MERDAAFEVVHDKVVVRAEPSVKGAMLGVALKGQKVTGVSVLADNQRPWLRLSRASIDELVPNCKAGSTAWLLMDGASVGLGQLLRPLGNVLPNSAKMAAVKAAAAAKVEARPKTEAAPKEKAPTVPENARQTGPKGEFMIVHEKAVVRHIPSTKGAMLSVLQQGDVVTGTPFDVDGQPWILVKTGWMLVHGKSVGLGQLLESFADIAEDILDWARQQKLTAAGKEVTWTAETETELLQLEAIAREQVAPLRLHENPQAWQELLEKGFITHDDFTLGPDGVAQRVLRELLGRRAGVLVLAESPSDNGLPWEEQQFRNFFEDRILPLTPFSCKLLVPDEVPTQRLLVLLHGSYVRGDDLWSEAEVLRSLMPETAIALPEAPCLVDDATGLRTWWPPPAQRPESIREAIERGLLKAPGLAISRLVATSRWLQKRFGTVPVLLGGFSQGAMLASQALSELASLANHGFVAPKGLVLLSGLATAFEVPPDVRCLALHGDQDEMVPLELAQEVLAANNAALRASCTLEVIKGLGHEISDAILDRIASFCTELVPVDQAVVSALSRQDLPAMMQEANQKKLLRWVKTVSNATMMFDDERFMSVVLNMDMVGLGSESKTIGGGLIKYEMHDVGKSSRGTVVIFHGKIKDLREDTRALVDAYKRLGLNVCILDYRQKFSQFGVDATIVLEELDTITGDDTSPVLIHGIGMSGIHALHIAIAVHSYPKSLRKRLCHLVLDGSVSNFKSLPPMPTGCIATDPIGNDHKLKYVGMPMCILGGDDVCCGHIEAISGPRAQGHYTYLSEAARMLVEDGQLATLSTDSGTALMNTGSDARLSTTLYDSTCKALDVFMVGDVDSAAKGLDATKRFLEEVMAKDEDHDSPDSLAARFEEEELQGLAETIAKSAAQPQVLRQLWAIRRMPEAKRSEELMQLLAQTYEPHLKQTGKLSEGIEGFRQFESVMAISSTKNKRLAEIQEQMRETFDLKALDMQVAKLERDKKVTSGITLEQCHIMAEESKAEWANKSLVKKLLARAKEKTGPAAARAAIMEHGTDMSERHWTKMGLKGSYSEMEKHLNTASGAFARLDLSLGPKMASIQGEAMRVMAEVVDALAANSGSNGGAKAKPKATSKKAAAKKAAAKEIQVIVHIARDLELKKTMKVPQGSTALYIAKCLAKDDPIGVTSAPDFSLVLNGQRLDDDAKIEEDGTELDIDGCA